MPEIKEQFTYVLSDKFNLEDIESRKLYINYDIDDTLFEQISYHILRFNTEDKGKPVEERKPILLYCTSNGGSVADGFGLIDIIMNSKTPVYTINLAYQYSMGFLIGIASDRRYAMPNATYLMHDGSSVAWNSTSKLKDQLKFQEKQENRIKDYILSRSKLTSEEYDEKLRVEWYMYADEAKQKGFVDYIIGADCDMEDII